MANKRTHGNVCGEFCCYSNQRSRLRIYQWSKPYLITRSRLGRTLGALRLTGLSRHVVKAALPRLAGGRRLCDRWRHLEDAPGGGAFTGRGVETPGERARTAEGAAKTAQEWPRHLGCLLLKEVLKQELDFILCFISHINSN